MSQVSQVSQATLRLATFLSPLLYETYASIARYLGEQLDLPVRLQTGQTLTDFARGEIELGFLCGLLYVRMQSMSSCPVELLAAPVLHGERYQDRPRYFSDVIVRRASPFTAFEDLHGCTWAYNERLSHSGYNLVSYSLLQRGLPLDYFGASIESGSHLQSLRLVLDGEADAAALDSHLLDTLFQQRPELARELRVIEMLGPSGIPPLVVTKRLDLVLKGRLQDLLLTMHQDPLVAAELARGQIKRFARVAEEDYDDIRTMYAQVQLANAMPLLALP